MFKTIDPDVFILEQEPNRIKYFRKDTNQTWEVFGVCNKCGDCIIGAVNHETELDTPVTPNFENKFPRCSLKTTQYAD
jgi:hypothetical protein